MIKFFIRESKITNLLLILVLVSGIYVFLTGRKEAFPAFTINQVFINVAYPGATAETVEELITWPVEKKIRNISGIDEISSVSRENLSSVTVSIRPEDSDKLNDIKTEIKTKIDELTFPEGSEPPKITVLDENVIPVVKVLLSGGDSLMARRNMARMFERKLLEISGVSGVDVMGYPEEEIRVECDPELLDKYYISLNEVVSAIRTKNVNIPAGEIYKDNKAYLLRIKERDLTVKNISNIIVRANASGNYVRLSQVAAVKPGFKRPDVFYRANGLDGIAFSVKKNKEGDTIKIVNAVKKLTGEIKESKGGFTPVVYDNTAFFVRNRLDVLANNAFLGLVFVVLVLFLFFDPVTSFWTVLGMPVSFCAAIVAAYQLDITLNLMSMFGFIIVVGMIVDDAIVVAENIFSKRESGVPPEEAAQKGTLEVIFPVIAATFTTIAAFLPLLMVGGVSGEFFAQIPKVVTITLIASLVECAFVLPGHLAHSKMPSQNRFRKNLLSGLQKFYGRFLARALRRPVLTLIVFIVFSGMIVFVSSRFILFSFFSGRFDEISVEITAPESYSLTMTKTLTTEAEEAILNADSQNGDMILDILSSIGVNGSGRQARQGDNLAEIRLILNPDRGVSVAESRYREVIRQAVLDEIPELSQVVVNVKRSGPPAGKDISIVITGSDLSLISEEAARLKAYIRSLMNIRDVRSDNEKGKPELHVEIDPRKAASLGLNALEVGRSVRQAFDGTVATTLKKKGEEVDVQVGYDAVSSATTSTFNKLKVPNRRGQRVKFSSFADVAVRQGPGEIRHNNGRPAVTVTASLSNSKDKVYTGSYLNEKIRKEYTEPRQKQSQVSFRFAGQNEEMNETLGGIGRAYLVAFFLIFIVLIALFKNYVQPLIILVTIPFTVVGVFAGLALNQSPLGYQSMIGIVALSGIVVNDAVIMLTFINKNFGMLDRYDPVDVMDSIKKSALSRLRPVLITTITTVIGLIPMAYGLGGREEFLEPLGIAIVYGIVYSTITTLVVVPLFAKLTLTKKSVKA